MINGKRSRPVSKPSRTQPKSAAVYCSPLNARNANETLPRGALGLTWLSVSGAVSASRFGKVLAERAGAALDKAGRVLVEPDLTVPGHPEIHVIGDLASFNHQNGKPLPGVAPVAMQQGSYVADLIRRKQAGHP